MANNSEFITFRLKSGKTKGAWQLGISGMMANKDGYRKLVEYVPGSDSIFKEDHKGDAKPVTPWFDNGLLKVHRDDKPLLEILRKHNGYNRDFEVVDEDREAEKELALMELQERALAKVNVAEIMELRANAIVLMGNAALTMSDKVTKMKVKKMAFEQPQNLLDEMASGDFHGKYIAALSVLKGVLEMNNSRTQIMWADTKKTLLSVPVGQDPIQRLGVYLSGDDEQALITLQELGEKCKRPRRKFEDVTGEDSVKAILEEKEEKKAPADNEMNEGKAAFEDYADDVDIEDMDLEEASGMYKIKFNKDVPMNMKNNLEWIKNKISEE